MGYSYDLNGRSETLTIGCYGPGGIPLAEAMDDLHEAKRKIAAGISPAQEKARSKDQQKSAKSFDDWSSELELADQRVQFVGQGNQFLAYAAGLRSLAGGSIGDLADT